MLMCEADSPHRITHVRMLATVIVLPKSAALPNVLFLISLSLPPQKFYALCLEQVTSIGNVMSCSNHVGGRVDH